MTRILLMSTTAPARTRRKAEEILAGTLFPSPELSILCHRGRQTTRLFGDLPGVELIFWNSRGKRTLLRSLNARKIDILYVFWTGERAHRLMKAFALAIRARSILVDIGDGGVFRLTLKAIVRHTLFRRRHPLPTDYWEFLPPPELVTADHEGEKILIIQSAHPKQVLQALETLQKRPLFRNPRYTIFCRNHPDSLRSFHGHPLLNDVLSHSETRGWWSHLRDLRRERFDALVLFFTGDPSYWKIRYFAFLLGARHKVIFNENNDCFYFSWSNALTLLLHRLGERSRANYQPRWTHHSWSLTRLLVKALLLPFRFGWLLLIWLRLRCAALIVRHEGAPF